MKENNNGKPRFLNALIVVSFNNATASGLTSDIAAWIDANANQRTFVQIDYLHSGTNFVAFLTYTE